MKTTRTVVAVYENPAARDKAVGFCDSLIKQSWSQCEYDISWCSYSVLDEPASAKEAIAKAAEADVVVLACEPGNELPPQVNLWLENWANRRKKRGGWLADLADPKPAAAGTRIYLQAVAMRAGMDYLTGLPDPFDPSTFEFPESMESYHERASQVTEVLEGILHKHPLPRL